MSPPPAKKSAKKSSTRDGQFRHALDTCSKTGDYVGALALYDAAVADGVRLSAYHFNSLLHLLSSKLNPLADGSCCSDPSDRSAAVDAGFRIFDAMLAAGVVLNEATVTSMARIAAAKGADGGDIAFGLVKTMGERFGATPKLRTYCPVLFAFCQALDAEKAYAVEDHMTSMGVVPQESEIAALLEVSSMTGREDKVYEYLQKLRSNVGRLTASTSKILEGWFAGQRAAEVGGSYGDTEKIKDAILANGGGWHGMGWLGQGKWEVNQTKVDARGNCCCCGLDLACVDINQEETEQFAKSVAGLAMERESRSNFKQFQEWLEHQVGYEAIVDGANVGLYQQNFADGGFSLTQLNSVVKELYERSKRKWPLIILHKKRIAALMENQDSRKVLETWKSEGALYTTPSGSNDDWYWLYAAVKLKCLLVTNDEMRDHIFELLGRSFFPKWKARHQVKYTFAKGNLVLMMPPPYTIVIQESERGSWHVPFDEQCNDETLRTWLCISRPSWNQDVDEHSKANIPTGGYLDLQPPSENGNGVQELSSPRQSSCSKDGAITGKRKERSSP